MIKLIKKIDISKFLRDFLALESMSGILLIIASILALIFANSNLNNAYQSFLHLEIYFRVGSFILAKPLHVWINELLMAFFFMVVGLEIKEELVEGHLSDKSQIILPLIGTIAGVVMPAIIYIGMNYGDKEAMRGWAIPIVTDIAFALCVLSFFNKSVPSYLRVFLLSLAIFDDLIGIIVIALFYTNSISIYALEWAAFIVLLLVICNYRSVTTLYIYMILGMLLWYFILKSGIHATIAGIIVGLLVPIKGKDDSNNHPLKRLMKALHPWVSYLIVPIFAFANSGLTFENLEFKEIFTPLPLGIILALFLGKQIGVFLSLVISVRAKLVTLPYTISWVQLYGISTLTGIGFTVSLFIVDLSFKNSHLVDMAKVGTIIGSLLSALWGFVILLYASRMISK
jgi:NhaA family Na+:H+ antiporter